MAELTSKPLRWRRWRFRLGIVLVFALGVVIGALGSGLYVKHTVSRFVRADPGQIAERVFEHLDEDLHFTPEQARAIRPIVEDATRQLVDYRKRIVADLRGVLADAVSRAKEHLTPEQQAELDDHVRRFGPDWHRRRWHSGD